MKCMKFFAPAAIAVALFAATQAAANQLANAGFESPIAAGGNVDGNWNSFSGNASATSVLSTVAPHSGLQHLDSTIAGVDNSFTGVFQWVRGISVGTTYDFSIWARRAGLLGMGAEFRIEYTDAGGAFVDGQFAHNIDITGSLTEQYQLFNNSSVAPVGAVDLKVVFAAQTFGAGDNVGTVYVDDASLVVPEPAAISLLGLGGLALVGIRRRRS